MNMIKYSSVPIHTTLIEHVAQLPEWQQAVARVPEQFVPYLQVPGLSFDAQGLRHEMASFHKEYGIYPWQRPNMDNQSGAVVGASLTYNPDHAPDQWLTASFGSSQIPSEQHCQVNGQNSLRTKGSYFDSLCFRKMHPGLKVHCPELTNLLNKIKFPLVRLTARTVLGYRCKSGWHGNPHVDESPFEVLRLNLALENNGDFVMDYETGDTVAPVSGEHFIVNGHVRHAVRMANPSISTRTHLVIGILPWLNYHDDEDAWSLNEYCGRMHPFDMVKEGLIF